jgi:hypothetical protein
MLTNLRLRWRALWKRRQLESDLEDELAFHLAMREQKKGEGAQRAFGNVELVKEDLRVSDAEVDIKRHGVLPSSLQTGC